MTIISHRYRFIFLKTGKTAGTSVQLALGKICGPDDICSPVTQKKVPRAGEEDYVARNHRGLFIPRPFRPEGLRPRFFSELKELARRQKYKSHMPATDVRWRLGRSLWDRYFKFSIERNPWDKAVSQYFWQRRHLPDDLSFEAWLPGAITASSLSFLRIDGRLAMDRVLRYENLAEEFDALMRELGVDDPPALPRAKVGLRPERASYRDVHTPFTRDYVARVCAPEIEAFGYEY
jgi:hypothetical protein